jgi:hypothetical protein
MSQTLCEDSGVKVILPLRSFRIGSSKSRVRCVRVRYPASTSTKHKADATDAARSERPRRGKGGESYREDPSKVRCDIHLFCGFHEPVVFVPSTTTTTTTTTVVDMFLAKS